MPKGFAAGKRAPATPVRIAKEGQTRASLHQMLWRLERLERQVQRLSELVREHAEDEDRLVRIVAEDRDVLRRELLRHHQARVHKRRRRSGSKP